MLQIRFYRPLPAVAATLIAFAMVLPAQAQSAADCAARADRASRDSTSAVAGGVIGGVSGKSKKNDLYKRVYDDCMAGR